ncbi:MAG: M23 family metallopeptidase [Candidatus Peribacteraceae bacterium]|nr:M23 family metallopeptidase [Candidatus Peribacteraceae bacterium]
MIFCPVAGEKGIDYRISQWFGERVSYYTRYGLKNGHNGIDLAIPIGTDLYAPFDGYITYGNEGSSGYGKFVTLISDPMGPQEIRKRVDLGHLSNSILGLAGTFVYSGTRIAMSGNTGDSTGPHVHITYKQLDKFNTTLHYDNGSKGALDVSSFILEFLKDRVLRPS